jgi:hypothetical protein
MKESIKDDLTEQALDIFLENETLQTRIIEPMKRKVLPYVLCVALFNIILFMMVLYLTRRLSQIL